MSMGKEKAKGGRGFDDVERAADASRLSRAARVTVDVQEPVLFVVRMSDHR